MVKGLGLRSKLCFQSLGQSACSKIIQICKWLLRIAFGRNLSSKEFMVGYLKEYKREDMKFNDSDKIKVFGYEASKNVIITFSITVLSAYSIAYVLKDKSQYLSNITKNPLLVMCGALLVLWVVDYILPNLLFWAINLFIKIRNKLAFMKFKF